MLFAIREALHESLGFSPVQLFFGRKARGALKLVKDKWINSSMNQRTSVSLCLGNLKNILCKVRQAAKSNLCKSQKKLETILIRISKLETSVSETKP